jgi:membrane protein
MTSRKNPHHRRAHEPGRGRDARSPRDIPAAGWKDIAGRVWQSMTRDHVSLVAAGTAFFGLLAIFPAMTALVSLYGLVADPASIRDHAEAIRGVAPEAAADIIETQLERIVEQTGTAGLAFVAGLAVALWSANAGMKSLFEAMNVAYGETEKRSFVWLNLISMALTLGAMVVLIVFMIAIAVVPAAIAILGLEGAGAWLVSLLRWPIILVAAAAALAVVYRYGPSRTHPQWRWVTPGSVLASVGWVVASMLLSWYVSNFADYNETYGTLGAAIGLMMWFWISALVVLVGAELNAELEHQTAEDTTVGSEQPLDERGATMADDVGRRTDEAA